MVNLSFLHGSNVSVTAGISLWESRISCFCCIFYSMPYVAGANLMTLDKELFERVQKRREQVRLRGAVENTDQTKRKGLYSAEYWYVQNVDAPTAIYSRAIKRNGMECLNEKPNPPAMLGRIG